jgi:hypothetical protein
VASEGALALVPSTSMMVKPEVPSPGVGSPPRWLQQCDINAGLSSGDSGGKVAEGVFLEPLYRAKSPGVRGESPRIHPSTESKIATKFVMD